MSILKDIATLIRAARKAASITQQELTDRLGIDQGYVSRIEGDRKGPRLRS